MYLKSQPPDVGASSKDRGEISRSGELAALKREDIDTKSRVILVWATYDADNRLETVPKTLESCREVYMRDELLRVIRYVNAAMLSQR